MGESKRLIKNTGIIAIGNLCTKLVTFLLLPLYTSILSTAEYGTVDYVTSISIFLVPVSTLLMDEAVFRFLIDCRTEQDRERVITSSMALFLLGMVATLIVLVPILIFLRYRYAVLLVLFVLSSSTLQIVSSLLRGLGKTSSYAVLNFIAGFTTVVLNVLFIAVFRWGVLGMLSASVVGQFLAPAVFVVHLRLWREIKPKAYSKKTSQELFRYALPLIPNKVSWTIMNLSDRLVIMNTIGASSSGLYAVSYKFPNAMDMVYGFFYMSWKESSARALGSDEDEGAFYNLVYDKLKRFMMSVVIGMTACMPLVFKLLVADSYNEAILYVPVLLLATYYSNISGFYGGIFTAYKDTKVMGTTTVVAAVLNLVLNLVLISYLGLWGSSLATLAATFVVNEYRRVKVKAYVSLAGGYRFAAASYAVLALVLALYYWGTTMGIVLMLVIAAIFFLVANREMVGAVLHRLEKKGIHG